MAKDRKTGGQDADADSPRAERAGRLRDALRENLRKRKAADAGSAREAEGMLRRADPVRIRGNAMKKPDRHDS
jgi:hypothetical protein